ncbi:hypothetical protein HGA88_06510 [Candidatus Roizmanbacteria bacterium]|nr:hypothetical protein [Candidatus Roizmanbacteria bacterium]
MTETTENTPSVEAKNQSSPLESALLTQTHHLWNVGFDNSKRIHTDSNTNQTTMTICFNEKGEEVNQTEQTELIYVLKLLGPSALEPPSQMGVLIQQPNIGEKPYLNIMPLSVEQMKYNQRDIDYSMAQGNEKKLQKLNQEAQETIDKARTGVLDLLRTNGWNESAPQTNMEQVVKRSVDLILTDKRVQKLFDTALGIWNESKGYRDDDTEAEVVKMAMDLLNKDAKAQPSSEKFQKMTLLDAEHRGII